MSLVQQLLAAAVPCYSNVGKSADKTGGSRPAFCILTRNIKQVTSKNVRKTGCEDGRWM
jgi:hypothetical protein